MDKSESTSIEESMNDEIVELVTKLNELYREAQLSQIEENSEDKNNEIAEKFMKDGDEHFKDQLFEKARRSYTFCVAYAEEDSSSDLIGRAYANRSAVLFKLGYFEQCLLDIDRALNSNYSEVKKKSLHERKEQASKKAEQTLALESSRTREVEAEWRDKLRDFKNPHIPGASNKIKLKSNKRWGRHLVATEDINAGEILTCQKFFTMVKAEDKKSAEHCHVCSHCLLYHPALIPCPRCTTMYCSEQCRTEAFNAYHLIECRIFQTDVWTNKMETNDFLVLRCLLVGTDQGAGLATLMEKIDLPDILDVEANIDKFTEKPFPSNDYMFLLRLCRKFHIPLADKIDLIPNIIIALRKAGYFDKVPDRLQHEAYVDQKADGYNHSKSKRDDDYNETDNNDIGSKVLQSVEHPDESDDKKEDPNAGKNGDRSIIQDHEDSSRIVGKQFVKKVTFHYCELCNICLYYNPEISQDEIVLAHCLTPLHVEQCSAKNSEEQKVTTQECVTETSPSKNVVLGTMAKKPQLDSASKRKRNRRKPKARLDSASAKSNDANEQKKFKREASLNAKYGNHNESVYENGDISSKVLESIEVVDEPVNKKEDPDGSENEDRRPEHEDSPKIAGKEFIKEVSGYYCELCNLCLRYEQEMSEDKALMAHCSTPLHLERSSCKTTEEKDVNTQECVTETLLSKMAEEPPSDPTSQPPESSTEISTASLDSLSASSDANEQNSVERQGLVLVKETSLFKNVNLYGKDVAKPGPSTATPQDDACSVDSNANQHQKTYLTEMELYASFLLLNHRLSIDNATFTLRKSRIVYGLGVSNLHAMLNHSCDPNAYFIVRGQEMALFALRPITKGDQICIAYTVTSFAFNALQSRQELLMSSCPSGKLQFNCECEACVNNWPRFDDMLKSGPKFLISKTTAIKKVYKIASPVIGRRADSKSRLEIIQVIVRLCKWLYTNVKRPSAPSILCEQLLIRAMIHFYDTSSSIELTELDKKVKLQVLLSKVVDVINK